MSSKAMALGAAWLSLALAACAEGEAPPAAEKPDADGAMDAPDDVVKPPDAAEDAADDAGMDAPDVPARCARDEDCAGDPRGPACDVAAGECVRCTAARDACPPAEHCDPSAHTCVPGCRADEGCAAPDAGAAGLHCDAAAHACVACVRDEHCPLGQRCVGNACVPGCTEARGCPAGRTCCAGSCVDTGSDLAHCGGCGVACGAVTRGTPACAAGRCAVAACEAGYGDCDGVAANGCEADLARDPAHCGGCGMAPAEACNGRDDDCDGRVDEGFTAQGCVSLACAGSGRVFTISDGCIDDGGGSAGGDSLEVYCVGGIARFCLSGEACPWRAGVPAVDDGRTCSRAGLGSDFMATASCGQWNGRSRYACNGAGQIYFP